MSTHWYIIYSHTSNLSGINNAVTKWSIILHTTRSELNKHQWAYSIYTAKSTTYISQIRIIGYSTLNWFFLHLKSLFRRIYCPKWGYSRLKQLTHTMWWHRTMYVSTINSHSSMEPSKTRPSTKRGNSHRRIWLHDK